MISVERCRWQYVTWPAYFSFKMTITLLVARHTDGVFGSIAHSIDAV